MSHEKNVFEASHYEPGTNGILSPFDPGARDLPAGYQVAPMFRPLPVDIVFEKDVAVTLRDGVTIYVDVFRPAGGAGEAGDEKVPVIVAWSPYGKSQRTAPSVIGLLAMIGFGTGKDSRLGKVEGQGPGYCGAP